ncbi:MULTISPECIES: hypothetical protein [unclassified Chryseobacterium]|uniref:hypothetical protein n=1 Tax=unclassified Chryseobacterium TaxID=2593645 RepID=UPI00100A464A|nr:MULTISPECIES: hypothetical protein [unclassified Chryseobacterium]RXM53195.1 hypothetical protein BOQ64_02050 [Chryseobacterium sp. CH25]RXM65612.1 hypothetical protein BOQ60_07450 [Chryseobacterium sp. CH1]
MAEKELNQLTDQELIEKKNKSKSDKIISAVLIGFLIGVAVYGSVTHGIGFFTFFPLGFALFLGTQWNKRNQALEKELESRNLK